jgi:hypothetical protein
VCAITGDSASHLAGWIGRVRAFADEVVIGVDASSHDDTLEIAGALADKVLSFEHPDTPDQVYDMILRQAQCDWILSLDDDELMSRSFERHLPTLLADRQVSHYLVSRRWVVPSTNPGEQMWLRDCPWYPDSSFRLMRNLRSLFHHPPAAHTHTEILGHGRMLSDEEGCIYHLDLVWKSRVQREAKVTGRYGILSTATASEYYLYEDTPGQLRTEPVPPGELDLSGPPHPSAAPRDPPASIITIAEMAAVADSMGETADIFAAQFIHHITPAEMLPRRGYLAEIGVRNVSQGSWRCGGRLKGHVLLSYHWLDAAGGMVVWDGRRSYLPRTVWPGEEVTVLAGLWTPDAPGDYLLQWDLVAEGIEWFGDRGSQNLTFSVRVGPG